MNISGLAMASCYVCTNIISPIIQRTRDIGWDEEVDLGTWGEYTKRKTCTTCCWIVRYLAFPSSRTRYDPFNSECRLWITCFESEFWITAVCLPLKSCERLILTWIKNSCYHNHPYLDMVAQKSSVRPDSLHYIESGHSPIDDRRIRAWASFCDSNHRGHCHGLPLLQSIEFPSSLTLIDVTSLCLTNSTGTAKYLALSYVWGQISGTLELNRTTASKLFDTGIFGLSEVEKKLPKTIRDAMWLTKSLDIRYLWVDRLCIVSRVELYRMLPRLISIDPRRS